LRNYPADSDHFALAIAIVLPLSGSSYFIPLSSSTAGRFLSRSTTSHKEVALQISLSHASKHKNSRKVKYFYLRLGHVSIVTFSPHTGYLFTSI